MEDWKKRYDKFEKRFWLKMKGRVYYDNYEVVTIKEGWNIEVKRFIEQEIEKAREEEGKRTLEEVLGLIDNVVANEEEFDVVTRCIQEKLSKLTTK